MGGNKEAYQKDHKFARVSRYGVKVEKHERTTDMWLLMIVVVGFCVCVCVCVCVFAVVCVSGVLFSEEGREV